MKTKYGTCAFSCGHDSKGGVSVFDSKHYLCPHCCMFERIVLGLFPRKAKEQGFTWKKYKMAVKPQLSIFRTKMGTMLERE